MFLECMVYSFEDIVFLGGVFDDEDEEDWEEDIKLKFVKKNLKCGVVGVEEGES